MPLPHRVSQGPIRRFGAVGLLLALVAACTYRGAIDEPFTLKATWFSYLNGDDIRKACRPGGPTWYRLVYNGNYEEQLRSYEVISEGKDGAYYKARVIQGGGIDLTRLSVTDPQAPGRWTSSEARLSPAEFAALESALAASGAFGPAPDGLRLSSAEFYWISAACRDGAFHYGAWRYPSERYAGLRFPEVLLRHDETGIPLNPPREVTHFERRGSRLQAGDTVPHFELQIGENGLRGVMTLL